jgi:hypothetical protein
MVVLLQGVFGRYVSTQKRAKKMRQNLKPFAGVAVADGGREKGEAQRQHEDVHHEILLSVAWRGRRDGFLAIVET